MRIAQIAPIIESVPPKKYGGTELVISVLTEELVKRGHKVTLFGSGDSVTNAKLFSVFHKSLREAKIPDIYDNLNIWSLLNVGLAYQMYDKFDIIHDHNSQNSPVSLPLANICKTPVVMTLHGSITNGEYKPFEFYDKPHLVTISKKQAEPAPDLNYIGNVYHGLHLERFPYGRKHKGYLLFVGRLHIRHGIEEKGMLNAIKIAEKLDMPLLIAAKLETDIKKDVSFFNRFIKPRLSDKILWLGEVDPDSRNKLMADAICLLHPVNFSEPFGLTLIEAMGTGCPVVAFDKGSIPEVVENGKTGFVVRSVGEAVDRVKNVDKIKRSYCREYALERFSAERMADEYEAIYYKLMLRNRERQYQAGNKGFSSNHM